MQLINLYRRRPRRPASKIKAVVTSLRGKISERLLSRVFFAAGALSLVAALIVRFALPAQTVAAITAAVPSFSEDVDSVELDETGANDDETISDDDESDDAEEVAEIPESLRSTVLPFDPVVISVFTQLGLNETLLPNSIFPQPAVLSLGRDAILNDSDDRIAEEFHVPDSLRDRVGFWFDVYTKYDSNQRIIHHSLYPWIVFKTVDVSAIVNSDTPNHLWMRRMKADRLVKEEALKVRATLKRLASRKRGAELTEPEKAMIEILAPLGGDARKQALRALRSVRIQTGQRDFFLEGLQLSSRYLSTMEQIFVSHRMPVELTRIPFVESSFNRTATSKVGAAGIWQIMDGTGRKFMKIDGTIDERRSPFKATEAAARLLKENHLILHRSWPLAVSAWNHGPGGIRLAAQRAGSYDLGKIVSRYRSRSFDFASSNFYCEFLAALHAERYSGEIFGQLERAPSEHITAIKLLRPIRFSELLNASGMNADDLLALNPEIAKIAKQNLRLPSGFRLHLPDWASENLDHHLAMHRSRTQPTG